jgi:spore coat polysaccharide biosynthesis protein SpsF
MVNVQVVIQARMGSTRLPGKVMLPIKGKPLLFYLFERLKKYLVVLATTTEREDDLIEDFCKESKIECLRGHSSDVLLRFIQALKKETTHVVRITADCPLVDFRIIDQVIKEGVSFDYTSNTLHRTYPRGFDVEMIRKEALIKAHHQAKKEVEREHVTPFIYSNPQQFSLHSIEREENDSSFRVTVDTKEDFELITKIFEELPLECSAEEVILFLKKHPEMVKMNAHVKQREIVC